MEDDAIDTSDIPKLDDEFFRHAKIKTHPGKPLAIKFYAGVLSWFRSRGKRLIESRRTYL